VASKHDSETASRLILQRQSRRAVVRAIATQYLGSESRPYNPHQCFEKTMIKRL
jgi:hypothetical protein